MFPGDGKFRFPFAYVNTPLIDSAVFQVLLH